jgi:hypothetical protein
MRVAAKKRPAKVRPRTPARIRKKRRRQRAGAHQHPELIGLGQSTAQLRCRSVRR